MPHRLRDRRIENEWGLLRDAQRSQPSIVELFDRESISDGESFRLALHETSGIVEIDGHRSVISSHHVEIRFPRFFPSVLLEVRLARPVFHPNVDPQNGFVCLWNRFAVEYTAVAALRQLQRVISWELINQTPRHILQPATIEWHQSMVREWAVPLAYSPILATSSSSPCASPPEPALRRRRFFL